MAEHRGWAPEDADNEGLDARKAETDRLNVESNRAQQAASQPKPDAPADDAPADGRRDDDGSGRLVRPALTVSLAGCLDLESIHDRHLSEGAVALALGGSPAQLPRTYAPSSSTATSSPAARAAAA